MPKSELVQSVLRSMELIRLTASRPDGMKLAELAEAANLQKSTAYNLLRTLCAGGFLCKDSGNVFHLGPGFTELALAANTNPLIQRAEKAILHLHKIFPNDVITLSVMLDGIAHVKLRCSADQPGRIQHPENRTFPPYLTVTSLALYAVNPQMAAYIEQRFPFEDYGEGMWGSKSNFNRAVNDTLQRGYALRQVEDRFAAAFILPEGFVLGFGGIGQTGPETLKRESFVRQFTKFVWQE